MSESDSVAVAVAEILTHVKGLDRCRITYFLEHPSSASASSQEEFARDIRERANTLIQEVPVRIQRTSSQYHYLEGRIRNACVDYDPKAEELLDKCIRADSKHVEAWLELGACAWKKPDLSKALTCFQHAVDQLRRGERPMDAKLTAKALCLLSAALRAQLSSLRGGRRERVEKLQEALKLCQDALKLRAGYAFGQYSLGNTLLARFFLVGQLQESDLTKALEAYSSAISPRPAPTQPFINADLHVNYGVALQYCQRYTPALEQFHRALAIEPNFTVAKERLHSLQSYLTTVNEWVAKPKIQQRRWRDISKELRSEKTRKWATARDPLVRVAGADEMEGAGEIFAGERTEAQGMAILVAVLGQVSPVDEVPKTLIATDASSHPIVLAIYNFSPKFSALIGDQFLIPKPSLIRVKVDSTLLSSMGERQEVGGVEFPLIRVTDPCRMVKNGKQLDASMRAMTDLSISAEAN